MKITVCALLLMVLYGGVCSQTVKATVIPPSGLAPGSQYQVIFVTFSTLTATSSNIDDYNAFVSSEGAFGVQFGLSSGVAWHAVASTATVDAKDNAPSGIYPVYNTQGQLVAASSIYTGSLVNAVRYDEIGLGYGIETASVWTGSDVVGVGLPGFALGGPGTLGVTGFPGGTAGSWISEAHHVGLNAPLAFYALSAPITVPAPEPTTLALVGSALLTLAAIGLRRRLATS